MLLYVNGDSHSWGDDIGGPEFSYGKYLSKLLSAEFICDAEPARSNYRILENTKEFLKTNIPDLVVIGWSGWDREEWIVDNQIIKISGGTDLKWLPNSIHEKYKMWVIDNASTEIQMGKELFWHYEIWKFHQELKSRNIKHLFFNAFMHFIYIKTISYLVKDWGKNFINPYSHDLTYYYWCRNKGFTPVNEEFMHLKTDAHEAWANFLFNQIKEL